MDSDLKLSLMMTVLALSVIAAYAFVAIWH